MGGMWPVVLRALRARPGRALLTVIAVALGAAAVLGVQVTIAALDQQAAQAAAMRAGGSQLDVRAVAGAGLDAAQVEQVRSLPGVLEARPLLEKRVVARADQLSIPGLTVTVIGLDGGRAALRPLAVTAGRLPAAGSLYEVALDQGLAAALQSTGSSRPLRPGDDVFLTTGSGPDRFQVVGLTSGTAAGAGFSRAGVYVSDASARGPFVLGLHMPLVALRLAPGASAAAVATAVHRRIGDAAVVVDPRSGGGAPLGELRPLLLLVTVLSVVIGAAVTANSVAVSVHERRRDVGLLRAAGAGPRQVFRMFAAEAVILAAAGATLGVGAGLALGAVLVHHFAAPDLPSPPLTAGPLPALAAAVVAAGSAVLGAVLPAGAAARMRPLAALRPVPAGGGRERAPRVLMVLVPACFALAVVGFAVGADTSVAAGAAALLLGMALTLPWVAPMLVRLLSAPLMVVAREAGVAAANLTRRRNRTALTASGVAVSVATAVALSALTGGALNAGDRWVGDLFAGDAVVTSPATQPDAIATAVARTPGVRSASPVRFLAAGVEGEVLGLAAVDARAYAGTGRLDIVEGDRAEALTALGTGPAVLVPEQLADAAGWHLGRRLQVQAASGPVEVTVAGVVAHSFPGGDGRESLLLDRTLARRLFGPAAAGFDDLMVVESGSYVLSRLQDVAASYGMQAVSVDAIGDAVAGGLAHAIALLTALSWLAVIVAMLAVVNTLLVNVRQSTRELALLRAVGMSRRRVMRLVLAEALLLAAVGVVAGVATGCLLAVPLLHISAAPGFTPGFVFPTGAVAAAVATVAAAALAAVLLPARRVARSAIVPALRQA